MIVVSPACAPVLKPWKKVTFLKAGVSLGVVSSHREVIMTDASLIRWQLMKQQGNWWSLVTQGGLRKHINILELKAVYLALQHFLPNLMGRHVLVQV